MIGAASLGRVALALAIIAVLVAVALGLATVTASHRHAAIARGEARVSAHHAQASAEAGAISIRAVETAAAIDQLERSNRDEILASPGASAPIGPDLDVAGLRALCLRRAYADDQRCAELRRSGP